MQLCAYHFPSLLPELLPKEYTASGFAKGSINYKLRSRMPVYYTAMPPTDLSSAGLMVRRDASILRDLLINKPTQYHNTEIRIFWTTFKHYQDSVIEAQKDYRKHLQQSEKSRTLYHNATSAAALISDQHATKCARLTSLTRQLIGTSQPRLELPQLIALTRILSDAVVEHDAVFEQMEMMKQEAENFRRSYDSDWREAQDCNEFVQRLWDEYEVLRGETEDVMSLLRQL